MPLEFKGVPAFASLRVELVIRFGEIAAGLIRAGRV
jgi:hypothetical protein